MNIKELRKRFAAPYALSVLKRALELNPDEPDMETAVKEYAEIMKKRPTWHDFYFVEPSAVSELSVNKISVETEKYEPIYHLLAVKARSGKLEQKTLDQLMAIYGQHIEVSPIKTIELKGQLNNYYHAGQYLTVVGIETVPVIERSELTDEILETLAKNALYHYSEYADFLDRKKQEVALLESCEQKSGEVVRRLKKAKEALQTEFSLEKIMFDHPLVFGDSIVAKKYSFFSHDKLVREYMEIATKKVQQSLNLPALEIKIIQCEGFDLND